MEIDNTLHEKFMRIAIELAEKNVLESIGGPFGAVVVSDGEMIARVPIRSSQQMIPLRMRKSVPSD